MVMCSGVKSIFKPATSLPWPLKLLPLSLSSSCLMTMLCYYTESQYYGLMIIECQCPLGSVHIQTDNSGKGRGLI